MILGANPEGLVKDLALYLRNPFLIGDQMRRLTQQSLVPPSAALYANVPTLKKESRGEAVKRLQRLLNRALTHAALPETGYFGNATYEAVRLFQATHQLKPIDGIVGPKTWAALERTGGQSATLPVSGFPSAATLSRLAEDLPAKVITELPGVAQKYEINTTLRLAHFLAQCAHESSNFTRTTENMNYGEAGLLATFPKYFTADQAKTYARKPEEIGNRAYGNRMGNGDEKSGDGYKFRGRGYIQLTGRNNYTAFGKAIGVDVVTTPDLVATTYPLEASGWWWSANGMNVIADKGATDEDVKAVTKKVNGGTHGLGDRQKHFQKIRPLLI